MAEVTKRKIVTKLPNFSRSKFSNKINVKLVDTKQAFPKTSFRRWIDPIPEHQQHDELCGFICAVRINGGCRTKFADRTTLKSLKGTNNEHQKAHDAATSNPSNAVAHFMKVSELIVHRQNMQVSMMKNGETVHIEIPKMVIIGERKLSRSESNESMFKAQPKSVSAPMVTDSENPIPMLIDEIADLIQNDNQSNDYEHIQTNPAAERFKSEVQSEDFHINWKFKDEREPQSLSVKEVDIMNPIGLIVELCISEQEPVNFQELILRAGTLPIDQQLAPFATDLDAESLTLFNGPYQQLITALFPDDVATINDALRFQSVLSKFHEKRVRLSGVGPFQWNQDQIALSMMIYIANKMSENEMESMAVICKFIHFLRLFCIENKWDGMKLKEFWMEGTWNGSKPDHFGHKLTEIVCDHVGSEVDQFHNITEMISLWYHDALRRFGVFPVVLADCSVEDVVALFIFNAEDDDDLKVRDFTDLGPDAVDGVFCRFEKWGGDEMQRMADVMEWKKKIVEWIRSQKVDGPKLMETNNEQLIEGMMRVLEVESDPDGSLNTSCGAVLNLCRQSAVDEILKKVKQRQVTRFDALKQYLVQQHDVDEKEIDILHQMVTKKGYESETLLLSEHWMASGKAAWNQLECAQFIPSFLRDRELKKKRFEIGFDIDLNAVTISECRSFPGQRFQHQFDYRIDPRGEPKPIQFRWNRWSRKLKHCDTVHLLYLLQIACDLHRQWVIERNQYFASILRTDRFIYHVDGPRLITNLLKWHNEDKDQNVFDGAMVRNDDCYAMTHDILVDVGMFS